MNSTNGWEIRFIIMARESTIAELPYNATQDSLLLLRYQPSTPRRQPFLKGEMLFELCVNRDNFGSILP